MEGANKHYKVIFSERAGDMLIQHVRFMAQVSPEAAEKLRAEIIEASRSLQSLPERYLELRDPALPTNKYRKMIINKRYCLVYQIKAETVYIDYILDCRQDYQWLMS
ncbi:MAG TPA: type II toxin-antitoxin system RelE/ParE family toxin [Desulfosporosinus sp.]